MPARDTTLDAFAASTDDPAEDDGREGDHDEDATGGIADMVDEDGSVQDEVDDTEIDDEVNEDDVADDEIRDVADDEIRDVADEIDNEVGAVRGGSAVEPAVTTMSWLPGGTACESCGEDAARRWRTDAGFVCTSCVDWERTPHREE